MYYNSVGHDVFIIGTLLFCSCIGIILSIYLWKALIQYFTIFEVILIFGGIIGISTYFAGLFIMIQEESYDW